MNVFSFSVRRPVSVSVVIIVIVILGFMFGSRLNIESFPKIEIPVISISTTYEGAGPEEVEEQITIPIEDAVGSVGNIEEIESSSAEGISVVLVRFYYGTDMDSAAADIREKLDQAKRNLPDDADDPVITKADPSDRPIIRLALTSDTGNMKRLRSIAQNEIKKEIEKVAGIASVKVTGGEERAIVVNLDRQRLEALSIPVNSVINAIASENANVPSGRITATNLEFSVRSMGELKDVQDFENVMVGTVSGKPIFVRDVATVEDKYKEVRTYARYNGVPAVTLEVRKNTDANTVVVAEAVKTEAEKLNPLLPSGYKLQVAYDQSKTIRQTISNLQETGVQGAILAIIVILVFLGSFRSTFVIGFSIPFSVISTFLLMYFGKLTVNMMTLVGFILAIGNIVDASIVVLENIFRHMEMGKDPMTASIDGAQEVGGAVFGAAATTIIVFIPILLMKGLSGEIFTPLAKTFCFAIFGSFVSAVTIVPMLCSRVLKGEVVKEGEEPKRNIFTRFKEAWDNFFTKLLNFYSVMLKWSLNHRVWVIIISVLIFFSSFVMARFMKVALQGKWDRGDFNISIETPVGSSLPRTRKVVDVVENFMIKNYAPVTESLVTDIGQGPSGSEGAGSSFSTSSPRLGGFTVSLIPAEERSISMYDVQDEITERFKNYPGANIQVTEMFSISGKKALEILIRGENIDTLAKLANRIKSKLDAIPDLGLKNIDLSYRPGAPEYKIRVNRLKAADLGLGSGQVSKIIRALLAEDKISVFREGGNEYDIFVQLSANQRDSIEKIKLLKFMTPSGAQVALSEIADVVPSFGPTTITRKDRSRYVSIRGDTAQGAALKQVMDRVLDIVNQEQFPVGYNWVLAGEELKRQEIFGNMFQVLFLAIIFTYVLLALQFESFIHPITIMMAIPLELAGVFGALLITNSMMTMFSLLGLIMLVGIVVSNSIVLIDYIIQRKEKGLVTLDAIMEAAPLRLRPIMMTSSTTIIAMIPLALGLKSGSEMYQPLAIGSIGGLLVSTMLTLIVIPTVYSIFEDWKDKIAEKKAQKSPR